MRILLKITLLFVLLTGSLFANTPNIDECKTDLYYANGIMIKESKFNARIKWNKKAKELLTNNSKELAQIGKGSVKNSVSI